MSDHAIGKSMIENMIFEEILEAFPLITGRTITDNEGDDFSQIEGSPDFIIGLGGIPTGIEIAEIRNTEDAWGYFEEASRIAWKKHASYARRRLFKNPIILVLYSTEPPLFDIQAEMAGYDRHGEFDDIGFIEVWTTDFSDAYYSARDPRRPADMFCFKPRGWFGFHRIGGSDRKPYG